MDIWRQISTSRCILLKSHYPQHALAVADDVLLMQGGTEDSFGITPDVLSEQNLTALYGVPLKRIDFEYRGKPRSTLFAFRSARSMPHRSDSARNTYEYI